MQDTKTSTLLESFDNFLSDVNAALACKSFLEEENRVLKFESDQLMADVKRKDEIISSKDEEIGRLLEKSFTLTKEHTSQLKDTNKEFRASALLVEMKYEVEVLLSNQRAHGRELSAQKTENERLLRFNQQLARELSMAKLRCSELERSSSALKNQQILQGSHSHSQQQHQQNQAKGQGGGQGQGGGGMFQRGRTPQTFSSGLHK